MTIEERLKFWEDVYKYAKHSRRKEKAKMMVEIHREAVEVIRHFNKHYNLNGAIKSTLEK